MAFIKLSLFFVVFLLAVFQNIHCGTLKAEKFITNNGKALRIMQFNTWIFGDNVKDGIYKLSKHIKLIKPDIVALQEVQTKEAFAKLLEKLGPEWSGVTSPCTTNSNIAILTIHQIDNTIMNETTATNTSFGVNIKLKDTHEIISFWCLHLDWQSYGPYAANNKHVTKLEQIMKGEFSPLKNARGDDIRALLRITEFQEAVNKSNQNPLILCGDFNTPSHLDWIEENKDIHGGWAVKWPATHLLQTSTGLIDSFREMHPNPIKNPGITWSTVHQQSGYEWDYSIPEPMDRIDFIMYKSPKLKPVNSFIYSGNEPIKQMPNHENNDYPSDHFSVITDFTFK